MTCVYLFYGRDFIVHLFLLLPFILLLCSKMAPMDFYIFFSPQSLYFTSFKINTMSRWNFKIEKRFHICFLSIAWFIFLWWGWRKYSLKWKFFSKHICTIDVLRWSWWCLWRPIKSTFDHWKKYIVSRYHGIAIIDTQ